MLHFLSFSLFPQHSFFFFFSLSFSWQILFASLSFSPSHHQINTTKLEKSIDFFFFYLLLLTFTYIISFLDFFIAQTSLATTTSTTGDRHHRHFHRSNITAIQCFGMVEKAFDVFVNLKTVGFVASTATSIAFVFYVHLMCLVILIW
jgi:hypothetical protein